LILPGQTFVIHERYSLIKVIGHGAYGVVISASDKQTGKKFAIKKIAKSNK
jgi:serine/threonine protein kinase